MRTVRIFCFFLLRRHATSIARRPRTKGCDGRQWQQMTAQQFAQELAYRLKDQDALSAKDPKVVSLTKARTL